MRATIFFGAFEHMARNQHSGKIVLANA